jgi:hypothetical protein
VTDGERFKRTDALRREELSTCATRAGRIAYTTEQAIEGCSDPPEGVILGSQHLRRCAVYSKVEGSRLAPRRVHQARRGGVPHRRVVYGGERQRWVSDPPA